MTTTTTTSSPPTRSAPRRRRRLLVGVVMVLLIAAAAAWAITRVTGSDAPADGRPAVVTADGLAGLAADTGHAVYWAGTRPGVRLEWTRTSADRTYVRYLPQGVAVGDRRPEFLTIATYPYADPRAAVQATAGRDGMRSATTPDGGLAAWSIASPTSVYYAAPGAKVLVEVFSPNAETARSLATSRAVTPVG